LVVALKQQDGESELFLSRSIDFLDTTFDTALEQANVILRYFLGTFFLLCLPNPRQIDIPFSCMSPPLYEVFGTIFQTCELVECAG
jgi:hypothetical protein